MAGLHYRNAYSLHAPRVLSIESSGQETTEFANVKLKNKDRPVYLNLMQIRLPVGGVASILHRISGFLLVLLLPFALYALDRSLHSPAAFGELSVYLTRPEGKIALLIMVWAFAQHFFSGLRHLLLDVGLGDSKLTARGSAWLVFILTGLMVVMTGVCLWTGS